MALKKEWKQTGVQLGHAFRDLGKTLIHTVKEGVDKADEWASREDAPADKTSETHKDQ